MRSNRRQSRLHTGPRRGALVIIVMICLLLVSLIGTSLVKLALAQRAQTLREQLRLQANWLAESGVDRAAARLSASPDYEGEEWRLKTAEAINGKPGRVIIKVSLDTNLLNRRVVSVVADYPSQTEQRARVHKQVVIDL